MSQNVGPFRGALQRAGLELFEMDIAAQGMTYRCNGEQAKFELRDGSFVVVAKTDSCRIIAGGFAEVDSCLLLRFADVLISYYRESHPAAHVRMPVVLSGSPKVPATPPPSPVLESACANNSLAEWRTVCNTLPATGGRAIKNPGQFCYLNAAVAALSACPQYGEQVKKLASESKEGSVIWGLANVFNDLNEVNKPALEYADSSMERLMFSLISAGCPLSIADYRQMEDAGLFLHFMLRAAGTQFRMFDIQGSLNVVDVPLLMPTLPEGTPDGDDRINLQGCIGPFVLFLEAPRLLPIWLGRSVAIGGGGVRKVNRACYFPLKMDIDVRNGEDVSQVSYYLRAVILHYGSSAESGHYMTVVPTSDGMTEDSPYPLVWEVRNDSSPKVRRSDSLVPEIRSNAVCYLYERAPLP